MTVEKAKLEESLGAQERSSSTFMSTLSFLFLTCPSESKMAQLEATIQQLRSKLADSQRAAKQNIDALNETIKSLGAKHESTSASIHLDSRFIEIHVH